MYARFPLATSARTNNYQETIPKTYPFNTSFVDLLNRIFVYDPKNRITAKQALEHPWFQQTLQDDGTEAKRIQKEKEKSQAYR